MHFSHVCWTSFCFAVLCGPQPGGADTDAAVACLDAEKRGRLLRYHDADTPTWTTLLAVFPVPAAQGPVPGRVISDFRFFFPRQQVEREAA